MGANACLDDLRLVWSTEESSGTLRDDLEGLPGTYDD